MPLRTFQNNFTTGVLSPGMYSRTDLAKYRSGCKRIVNAIALAHGGITRRPGTRYVDTLPGPAHLIRFSYSRTQNYVLAFLDGKVRFYLNGGVLLHNSAPYEIVSPYTYTEARMLHFVQSGDVLILAHPAHPPRTLTRTGHTDWTFEVMAFEPSIAAPAAPTATPEGFDANAEKTLSVEYKISATSDTEEESYPSPAVEVMLPKAWTANATVKLSWTAVTGAKKYQVYKNKRGFYGWIGTVDAADTLAFTDDNIDPAAKDGPKEAKNPFADGNHPGVVGIYQQRLIFARSDRSRQTVWCSQPGNFCNFSTSYPLKDDDSIEAVMDSREMDEIRHLLLLKRAMLVLTGGAEWTMTPGLNSDAITPSTTRFENQSFYGSGDVPPLTAGNGILMLQNSGKLVRDMYYTMTEEYSGAELSILAEHLFTSPVVDWTYQSEPYHTVYAVRADGAMLTLTYLREQEVFAWSEHRTQGNYRAVCALRNGSCDELYFLVERDGVFMLEFQQLREWGAATEDAFFVDCGASYRGEPTTTVSGLEYLAGQTVAILADGSVVERQAVTGDGKITLPQPAKVVHVGLPYETLIETLDPELNAPDGTTSGLRKNVPKAVLKLRESAAPEVGPTEEKLIAMKFAPPPKWGEPPRLASGDMEIVLPGCYRPEASVIIRQRDPLPLTVLSVVTHINSEI